MAYDFNNQAVAENFALRETMKLLRGDELAFLANAGGDGGNSKHAASRRKWFRSSVIKMVLATDMSQHFDLLNKFETKIQRNKALPRSSGPEIWNAMDEEQRILVLQLAIKVRTHSASICGRYIF